MGSESKHKVGDLLLRYSTQEAREILGVIRNKDAISCQVEWFDRELNKHWYYNSHIEQLKIQLYVSHGME